MGDSAIPQGSAYVDPRAEIEIEAILDGTSPQEPNLEQVREILFGAQSRRSEAARRALEAAVAERFGRLEAEHERRFEVLLKEMEQRFEKACRMLEVESAERRKAMQAQHLELTARLQEATQLLGQAKASREELADLLTDVATRLRVAASAS
jgi:hypothetical protein